MATNTFTDDPKVIEAHGYEALAHQTNPKGWELTTFRAPYYDQLLEFVQVDHPDGTSSYFRLDEDGTFTAGPFGGGYSWAVPKYVVEAAERFLRAALAAYEQQPGDAVEATEAEVS